jgi:hypothetical protein
MTRLDQKNGAANSNLREAWLAELEECDKRRTSLRRRMKRAERRNDRRKVADLEKEYYALCPAIARPVPTSEYSPRPESHEYVTLLNRSFGTVSGVLTDDELDKTIPRRLRSEKGRSAWRMLMYVRRASASEKESLRETLRKLWRSGNDAAYALDYILHRLDDPAPNPEFFSMLAIALEEEGNRAFQLLKWDLLAYRFSLNWSRTPEQPRHKIPEIKQIVAPNSSITLKVFGNLIHEFNVPHLPRKRGKGSPSYGRTRGGARQ